MISIQNLNFGYKPKHPLFARLNLQLGKGRIYGLLGKNGAGKSTLLKTIAGLTFPKSGTCMVNGINVSGRPVAALADIYFLPEEVYAPSLTPDVFAARTGIFYPKFSKAEFMKYLKALDIDPLAVMAKQSFGQQKKAMIAFGLATNTGVLLLDEPTNGLDIPSKAQFRKLIASVLTEDRCIIISTHQVRDLDSLIDTLVVLHEGKIVVNRQIDDIAERLTFGTHADTSHMQVLYEEDHLQGKSTITRNTTGQYSKIELELLFNAITGGNKQILESLKTTQQ